MNYGQKSQVDSTGFAGEGAVVLGALQRSRPPAGPGVWETQVWLGPRWCGRCRGGDTEPQIGKKLRLVTRGLAGQAKTLVSLVQAVGSLHRDPHTQKDTKQKLKTSLQGSCFLCAIHGISDFSCVYKLIWIIRLFKWFWFAQHLAFLPPSGRILWTSFPVRGG